MMRTDSSRRVAWVTVVVLVLHGLIPLGQHANTGLTPVYGQSVNTSTPRPDPLDAFDIQGLAVNRQAIVSGGPSKDGISALTQPATVPLKQAPWADADRVVVVTVNGMTRAYPINVLNWHEVINDELGQVPIAVVYCPLCDSVTVVDRRIEGQTLEFGVSGLLLNSNVLIYDRTHQALWSQVGFEAISGPYVGRVLRYLPWELTRFSEMMRRHPEATVIGAKTGYSRDYYRNPYARYFQNDRLLYPVDHEDDRLPMKSPVIGVRLGDESRAYPVTTIQGAQNQTLVDEWPDGQRLVLQASPEGEVYLHETPRDAQIAHTFWFAWSAFHPQTVVYSGLVK